MSKYFMQIMLVVLLPILCFAQENTMVDRVLASVDDEIILESEVLQIVQDIVLNNRNNYNRPEQIVELRESVLQELINQKILLAIALQDTNIIVEDREVDQTLDDRIDQLVREVGSVEDLEEYFGKPIRQIRREYRSQVSDGLFIEKLRNQKLMSVTVNRSEIESFYNRHIDELPALPERVHIAHILISIEPTEEAKTKAKAKADSLFNLLLNSEELDHLAITYSDDRASGAKGGLIGTTERGELFPEYEEVVFSLEEGEISSPFLSRLGYHIARLNWRRGEKINTSHILISLKPTDSDEKRALNLISSLRERIEQGEEFGEIAKEYSQDEETAKTGGDLGWFDLPNMPDEFRIVAKDLQSDEISDPFKSSFGIHILKVIERDSARTLDLYGDWERISRMAKAEKQDKIYRRWVEKARDQVYVEVFTE